MTNNPCEYAVSEISQFYRDQREKEPEFSFVVSMGTGYDPHMEYIDAFDKKSVSDVEKI